MRTTFERLKELPYRDRKLFWFCVLMLAWQSLYISHFFLRCAYEAATTAVTMPDSCAARPSPRKVDYAPGLATFGVDLRCTPADYERVFVALRGGGIREVLEMQKGSEPGVWFLEARLADDDGEPLLGEVIEYKYVLDGGREENLVDDVISGMGGCANSTDSETYAYRTMPLPRASSYHSYASEDVFGSCTTIAKGTPEWTAAYENRFEQLNPVASQTLRPVWKPIERFFLRVEVFDPVLFLTFCTLLYVYSIIVISRTYVKRQEADLRSALEQARHKNTYLEHAAKILRHDMHSGINTYIPRGIESLERRLEKIYSDGVGSTVLEKPERGLIENLRLEAPLKMLKEGLAHTQKVYRGVTEFTNLVRDGAKINKAPINLSEALSDYLRTTAYRQDVVISDLATASVNAPLFCTAVDNLIKNGLKYNDSPTRRVNLQMEGDYLAIVDNGRGMSQEDFDQYSKPYTRKAGQAEPGTGLGLNICAAILSEHGFPLHCHKLEDPRSGAILGTKIRIKVL